MLCKYILLESIKKIFIMDSLSNTSIIVFGYKVVLVVASIAIRIFRSWITFVNSWEVCSTQMSVNFLYHHRIQSIERKTVYCEFFLNNLWIIQLDHRCILIHFFNVSYIYFNSSCNLGIFNLIWNPNQLLFLLKY